MPLENYTFIPDRPLTCEFYGLILPDNDLEWRTTVNGFLASEAAEAVWDNWFLEALPYVIDNMDYCLNFAMQLLGSKR